MLFTRYLLNIYIFTVYTVYTEYINLYISFFVHFFGLHHQNIYCSLRDPALYNTDIQSRAEVGTKNESYVICLTAFFTAFAFYLKRVCHEIFDLYFFLHDSNPSCFDFAEIFDHKVRKIRLHVVQDTAESKF